MSKSKGKNYRVEDQKYTDGYHVNTKKNVEDKRFARRFDRALKIKNVDALLEDGVDPIDIEDDIWAYEIEVL